MTLLFLFISYTSDFSFFSPRSVFAINTAQAQVDEKMNHSYENIQLYFKQESQQVQQQPSTADALQVYQKTFFSTVELSLISLKIKCYHATLNQEKKL